MAKRKQKRKSTSASQVSRSPMVNIKQRDDDLASDLQNMKQKDAVKYSSHLMKMVGENPDYNDLLFNIPHLMYVLKKYELDQKPGAIKKKLMKQSIAKDSSAYVLPEIVTPAYSARARNLVNKKFQEDLDKDDKMALAIAKASLEMQGKVVQGNKVSISDIPLYQISLSASMDVIKKITKAGKDEKNLNLSDAAQATELFPRWQQDVQEFSELLEKSTRSAANDAKNSLFLPEPATALLQQHIVAEFPQQDENSQELREFEQKRRLKSSLFTRLKELGQKSIYQELIQGKEALARSLEKSLADNFSDIGYQAFAYLFFLDEPAEETLMPIYIYQGLLHLTQNNFQAPQASDYLTQAKKASTKEEELLSLLAAYNLGERGSEQVQQIASLYKDLDLDYKVREIYENFLEQDGAKKDKAYKKIQKEYQKNFGKAK